MPCGAEAATRLFQTSPVTTPFMFFRPDPGGPHCLFPGSTSICTAVDPGFRREWGSRKSFQDFAEILKQSWGAR